MVLMFHNMEQEVSAIELLLDDIDETTKLTGQGLLNTADIFVELRELEHRLASLHRKLGKAIVHSNRGADVIRLPKHTISFVSGHKTIVNWKNTAMELESYIDKDKYNEVVMHNTRMTSNPPTLRVIKNK